MSKVEMNSDQIHAVYEAEKWWRQSNEQVFEVVGPAGSGKTWLIKFIIDLLEIDLTDVAFVAFMGKAAMQMARNGLPATTVHHLIYEYKRVIDKDENGHIIMLPSGKVKMKGIFVKKNKISPNIRVIVLDEAGMIDTKMGEDILSFGLPVIASGDLNQLPPIFGKSFFLQKPDVILTKIMRQAEGNPIVWLSQRILNGDQLKKGLYGSSSVISKKDLNFDTMRRSDIILTASNRLRQEVNYVFRNRTLVKSKLAFPNHGEKIICRRNNWGECRDNMYLINGMTGFVDNVDKSSFNGRTLKIDFKPDFMTKTFANLVIDYDALFVSTGERAPIDDFDFTTNKFEFANAITTHLSQGSQWNNVLFMDERLPGMSDEDFIRLQYTAVTRAKESVTIAI